ncbi:hypothetical protein ACH4YN_39125 [Streptomyces griseofuscus]|uniref:Uncharacterized protein n=1 Tax=Streptomyces rochei TaxID=1928 RepID=A0A068Q5T3_STRRO|nr:hypothetical protein [Streptomyces rochei]BAP15788.1 hypothetical protein [Streptomyces rochei]
MTFVTRSKKAPEGATRIGYAAPKGSKPGKGIKPPEDYVPSGPVAKGQPPKTPKK